MKTVPAESGPDAATAVGRADRSGSAAPFLAALDPATAPLHQLLANRRWLKGEKPFRYVYARDVFVPAIYRLFERNFKAVLERPQGGKRFARNMGNYDALGLGITEEFQGPLAVFATKAWHDVLAGLFGIRASGHVNCGLHHHQPGGDNGFIHNDLNPGHFAEYKSKRGVIAQRPDLVTYTTGEIKDPAAKPVEVVRAVALLFYLANPPWKPGDGGETGLYSRTDQPVDRPDVAVPPLNNSLVAFECTPYSYHSFMTNRKHQRNSVVMWIHRSKQQAVARWGDSSIVYWK